jgi:hypothetical protein
VAGVDFPDPVAGVVAIQRFALPRLERAGQLMTVRGRLATASGLCNLSGSVKVRQGWGRRRSRIQAQSASSSTPQNLP